MITKVNKNQVRFQDPTGVIFIPYNGSVLGGLGYDVHDIVGDTFALTQDDADRTEIPWEFGDDPLDENVSLGARNVAMQCLDFQNVVMKNLFGWNTDTDGFAYAPSQYKDLNVLIILQFEGKNVVMPKVKLDSKAALENLRSDVARGDLAGVLYSTGVKLGSNANESETALMFVKNGKSFKIGNTTINIAVDGTVTIDPLNVMTWATAAADSSGKTFEVTMATGTVTVESGADWATATVDATGTHPVVKVTVTANTSEDPRVTEVLVFDDGVLIGTIVCQQAGTAA
jgi:hypothetical protein